MMDVVGSINDAISLAKRLRDIGKNIADAEFKNLLADLSNALGDAKLQVAELKELVAAQAEEIQTLKRARPAAKEKPSGRLYGCYQFAGEEGLYCTACYDTKGIKSSTNRLDVHRRSCPVCRAVIGAGN